VTGVHPPGRFGELVVSGDRVTEFLEKPMLGSGGQVNGGFFVFEPGFFEYLWEGDDCILEREPLERLARTGQLAVYRHHGFWACMDTYRDYLHLNELWKSNAAPWAVWRERLVRGSA
jgi:glucose-1-phosphate cytidylyltransferase